MSEQEYETKFLNELEQDCEISLKNLEMEDSGYNRRTFIRTYYSYLEGMLSCLRQSVLDGSLPLYTPLTDAEKAILSEESYYVNQKFEIKSRKNSYLTFEQSFRLSFRYFFEGVYDSMNISFGDGGWKALLDGMKIRNRITHPKQSGQLSISDEELKTVKSAKQWTDDLLQQLLDNAAEDIRRRSAERNK